MANFSYSEYLLSERDLRQVALRSFFIQSLWNYEKMQNLGWAWSVWPALKKIYPPGPARKAALKRHLEYFNTHPYVAGVIVGTVLRIENDVIHSGGDAGVKVAALRMGMMGPLAALGDVFYWATLRPLAAMVGVAIFFLSGAKAYSAFAACALMLLFFNVPHLLARFRGPWWGFERGDEMISLLRQVDVPRSVARAHRVGLVVLAAFLAGVGRFEFPGGLPAPLGDNLLFLGCAVLMPIALRFKLGVIKILAVLLGLSLFASALEPFTVMGK